MRATERLGVGLVSLLFLHLCFFRAATPLWVFSPIEGGVWIDEAERVLAGQVMYRDFFEFVPPGIVYLNAAVLAVFGRRVAVLALLQVALGVALTLAVHALAARVSASRWRLLPPAAFLVLLYASYSPGNHKWPALLCGLLGLLVLMGPPRQGPSFAAGLLLGGSTLFTLDFGLGLAAGAMAATLTERTAGRGRRALAMAGGWLAAVAGVAGAFAWAAGPGRIAADWLLFPLTAYRAKNALFFGLASHHGPRTAAQLVLAAAGVASAVIVLRRGGTRERVLALAGLGLLLATAHRPWTPLLLSVRCAPLLVPAVWALERGLARRGPARGLAGATLAVLVAGTAWGALSVAVNRQRLDPMVRATHRAGAVWLPAPMPELGWIEAREPEGAAVFVLPHKGGHHFLTRTRSVTSLPYLLDGMSSPGQIRRALDEIAAARPRHGVWGSAGDLPQAYATLLRLYEPVAEAANGSVLLRLRAAAVAAGAGTAASSRSTAASVSSTTRAASP